MPPTIRRAVGNCSSTAPLAVQPFPLLTLKNCGCPPPRLALPVAEGGHLVLRRAAVRDGCGALPLWVSGACLPLPCVHVVTPPPPVCKPAGPVAQLPSSLLLAYMCHPCALAGCQAVCSWPLQAGLSCTLAALTAAPATTLCAVAGCPATRSWTLCAACLA